VYLTNEVFLYRVLDVVASEAGDMVELEDCYWLDVVRVPVDDLLARQLRVVTPDPAKPEPRSSPSVRFGVGEGLDHTLAT
jgi:hypothetical protein